MPRERPLFRVNLDRLDEKFPDSEVLSYQQIADYINKSLSTVKRKFTYNKKIGGVAKATVARALSEE